MICLFEDKYPTLDAWMADVQYRWLDGAIVEIAPNPDIYNLMVGHKIFVLEDMIHYKKSSVRKKLVYKYLPVTSIGNTQDAADMFNQMYHWWMDNSDEGTYTPSLYPSTAYGSGSYNNMAYWISSNASPATGKVNNVALILHWGDWYTKVVFGYSVEKDETPIRGTDGFNEFQTICKEMGINIWDFMDEDPEETKMNIPKAPAEVFVSKGKVFYNVHHMDFNSAFSAGIKYYYPELGPVIDKIYAGKAQAKIDGDNDKYLLYKSILNLMQGYCQSEYCKHNGHKYALSSLANAALKWCNMMINKYVEILEANGRCVLATNVDGIWYTGDVWEDENCGPGLGQYKVDHTNCKIQFKGPRAYEYMENGKHNVVLSGITRMDKVEPDRSKWKWGAIFDLNVEPITFFFDRDKGICSTEHENTVKGRYAGKIDDNKSMLDIFFAGLNNKNEEDLF